MIHSLRTNWRPCLNAIFLSMRRSLQPRERKEAFIMTQLPIVIPLKPIILVVALIVIAFAGQSSITGHVVADQPAQDVEQRCMLQQAVEGTTCNEICLQSSWSAKSCVLAVATTQTDRLTGDVTVAECLRRSTQSFPITCMCC